MKILEMESLRVVEEMEQLTILQTLRLIFWMICFLGRKVCERLLAWLEFMLSRTMTLEQPSRVVVAETIRSEQLDQLLLPPLPNDLFVHHI
jgi:hypothetical protein